MNARVVVLGLLGWAFLGLAHAQVGAGPAEPAVTKSAFDKFSGKVRLFGAVDYSIGNLDHTARIAFSKLLNQASSATSGELAVWLFLTQDPIVSGDPFSGWFIANWTPASTLGPGESFDNINVTVPLANNPPDGVYYIHLGSFELGACGFDFCYDDIRSFPTQVRVYQGAYYPYSGPPQPGSELTAVEYFHAAMGHYFVTAQADEIVGLDAGVFAGWARTGRTFNVWLSGSGLADVCRFFTTAFPPKSSHFYTALAVECEGLKQGFVWQYEKLAFKVALPIVPGVCLTGVPLYRLYNDGKTGAPNHRYTTSLSVRAEMIAQGFIAEDPNTVCVASAGT